MNVTASGFGLALEAIFPWWAICSRFLSGDDGAKPGEDHAREEKAGETELLDGRTQVEVAAALGIPRSTLEGWEHRLAERLRRFVWESSQ